jgi:uncharacterized membrane protein HdeD (DUF308 family)
MEEGGREDLPLEKQVRNLRRIEMSTQSLTDEVKKRSAWSIFMGIVTAALGCFLIVYPMATAAITTVLLGWALIFVGLAQFVFALYSQTIGNFFLKVLLSLLYGICGIALAFFPIAGVAALTGVLGTLLLIQAGLLTATAFQLRPVDGWGWFLFDAATNLLLGILILAKWPSSSVWAIGTLVGVSVLMSGISRIMIATKIRSGAAKVEHFVRAA